LLSTKCLFSRTRVFRPAKGVSWPFVDGPLPSLRAFHFVSSLLFFFFFMQSILLCPSQRMSLEGPLSERYTVSIFFNLFALLADLLRGIPLLSFPQLCCPREITSIPASDFLPQRAFCFFLLRRVVSQVGRLSSLGSPDRELSRMYQTATICASQRSRIVFLFSCLSTTFATFLFFALHLL